MANQHVQEGPERQVFSPQVLGGGNPSTLALEHMKKGHVNSSPQEPWMDPNKCQAMIDGAYAPPQPARGTAFEGETATLSPGKSECDQDSNRQLG